METPSERTKGRIGPRAVDQAIGITPRPAGLSSWVRPTTLQDVEHFDLRVSAVVIGRLVAPNYPEKP